MKDYPRSIWGIVPKGRGHVKCKYCIQTFTCKKLLYKCICQQFGFKGVKLGVGEGSVIELRGKREKERDVEQERAYLGELQRTKET